MYQRPDAANGDTYDPSFRVSITDYEPKPVAHLKPYYVSDTHPDHDNHPDCNPVAYCDYCTAYNPALINTSPYQSKLHPYLYGLPRYGQGQAWS